MLIKSNKESLLTVKAGGDKLIVIMPGYNEIDDESWEIARNNLMEKILSNVIEEEWVKINPDQKDQYAFTKNDDKFYYAPASLKDITRARLKDVIKNTFSVSLLKKWLDVEIRPDVRMDIMKQLSFIEEKPEISYV